VTVVPRGKYVHVRTAETNAAMAQTQRERLRDPDVRAAQVARRLQAFYDWQEREPEIAARFFREQGIAATNQVWKCGTCDLTSNAMCVARHERARHRHEGRTLIGYRDNDETKEKSA
jgi:hypothetical protein